MNWNTFVDKKHWAFMGLAMGILHDRQAAEDIVQDMYIKLYQAENVKDYFSHGYRILKNECYNYLSSGIMNMKYHTSSIDLHPWFMNHAQYTELSYHYTDMEYNELFNTIFETLPDMQLRILMSSAVGCSWEEQMDIYGVSKNTIKTTLVNARRNIRHLSPFK